MNKMGSNIQSNAYRGAFMRDYVNRTIDEIAKDVTTVFGPGATDAYISKNGQPYYTRDGLEMLESIQFDNPLSEYVRKILYQAAYHQGKKVGDGTTTLIMLYCALYQELRYWITKEHDCLTEDRELLQEKGIYSLYEIRKAWNSVTKMLVEKIKEISVPITKGRLLAMLYTCTQDEEIAAHLYASIGDALMNEAYIIVNKSNLETELTVTSYQLPIIKATRLFTVCPMQNRDTDTVIFHCNGMLDISHMEVLWGLMAIGLEDEQGNRVRRNIVLLCNGITDVTRKATKDLVKFLNEHHIDPKQYSNVAIYALNEYREMSSDEIEDLSTIITEEKGIGGLVNSITFESLLYQAFSMGSVIGTEIEDLATFDCDIRFLDKIREMYVHAYPVTFNDQEGFLIERELGPVAKERYYNLLNQIENEKSEIAKIKLNKRLKRTYGQFIELEVGSRLLKDSQRKFELILDAVLSAAEAVRHGVSETNLLLALHKILNKMENDESSYTSAEAFIISMFAGAVADVCETLMDNCGIYTHGPILVRPEDFDYSTFDARRDHFMYEAGEEMGPADVRTFDVSVDGENITIKAKIVEPIQVMCAILENSTIPMELAMAKSFHVDAFMQNYI